MAFHRTFTAFCQRGGPITLAYKRRVKSGIISLDNEQLSLSAALDNLYSSLTAPSEQYLSIPDEHTEAAARYYGGSTALSSDNFAGMAVAKAHSLFNNITRGTMANRDEKRGIYVHGSVGVGKSMIMDLFYSICAEGLSIPEEGTIYSPINRKHKRCHFHEFMLESHQRIHAYKAKHPKSDPIPPVAAALAKDARLFFLDEMQITDIADAMIIKRLLTILLDLGVVIVTTSNRPPSGLYEGGINRSVFLPFIDTLRERMIVIEMGGTHDYRKDGLLVSSSDSIADSLPPYLCSSINLSYREVLDKWFSNGTGQTRTETLPVAMGRSLHVERANDSCGWFSFNELCNQPLGAADYIAIADRFEMIIVEGVPQLGGDTYNEARRFVTLVDALYEAKTKAIIAAEVPRDDLFVGFDASVETHDGDEEIAIGDALGEESFVVGEGGSSSSSSTTLIRTQNNDAMEWSATGRIGVSLAQLSSVKEVSFSFKRAESRLAEMAAEKWGRKSTG